MMKKLITICVVAGFILAASETAQGGATLVRTGTTYATIQQAVDAAIGGDTINVSPGTYKPFGWDDKDNLTVKSTDGPDTTFVIGTSMSDCPNIGGTTHITGVYIGWGSENAWIEGFDVKFTVGQGILVMGTKTNKSPGATIKNNIVHDSGSYGIQLSYAPNSLVEGNKVYSNYISEGIWVNYGGGVTIKGNDIHNNTFGIHPLVSGVEVHYNNIYGNNYGIYNDKTFIVNAEYNWWGDALGPGNEPGSTGNSVRGNVDYDPWLTAPIPAPGAIVLASIGLGLAGWLRRRGTL